MGLKEGTVEGVAGHTCTLLALGLLIIYRVWAGLGTYGTLQSMARDDENELNTT